VLREYAPVCSPPNKCLQLTPNFARTGPWYPSGGVRRAAAVAVGAVGRS
jgi:hypothetical protein